VAAHIVTQRVEHAVPYATSCRALGVSPAWFYKWRDGDVSIRRARRRGLAEVIRALFLKHRGTYGSPRITADLRELGWRVSEKTVAGLMAEAGLVARPKRRRRSLTRSARGRWRAPDLVGRKFSADKANQRWFGDGTEVPTGEGPLYLSSVLDIRSRRVVGFALSDRHDTDWAYRALAMAVAVRGGDVTGVVLHTDGGGEYVASSFRAACRRMGITQSMGRPGSALDNAAIESWHSTLTFELLMLEHFTTKAEARRRVPAWIDEYNLERKHSALGMRSPVVYELAETNAGAAAERAPVPTAEIVSPSSPASRPSPSGGLRPVLTPAAGGAGSQLRERGGKPVRRSRSA
jgi:putative transposase